MDLVPSPISAGPAADVAVKLLDRDHSILAFAQRVLDMARRPDVPLLERLRFLGIVSSNIDEFFEVRAAPHLAAADVAERGEPGTAASLASVSQAAHELVARQYACFSDELMPALATEGLAIAPHAGWDAAQREWATAYFEREVRPLLMPVGVDRAHPFPQVASKSLNFIVRLAGADAFGRRNEMAIVKVPRVLQQVIRMPAAIAGPSAPFVTLSSVIRAHLDTLFDRRVVEWTQFRVTRNSDLAVDDEEPNLRAALRLGLQRRHHGQATRIEVPSRCPEALSAFLLAQFRLPPRALYRVPGPVNLGRLMGLVELADAPRLRFPPYQPCYPVGLARGQSIFAQLRQRDVIIHQPYESFEGVLDFLREAVHDPCVLAIRQSIYRTGSDSVVMDLLGEAVRRGKEVTVVMELQARYDEETNINWSETLESIGAQVVYGIAGLKTHAKMLLVTRREGDGLRRYAHLSTGNYNRATAGQYTDLSHLTADPELTADLEQVFLQLAGQSRLPRLHRALVAPQHLHGELIARIEKLGEAAARGVACRMMLKMNALTDEALILALVRAGRQGVAIDLLVRGACMLPARVPGLTGNITVRSLVGRFLEHSRVFFFRCGDAEELLLSSADWMSRNMSRRVELAWPVTDPSQRQRIVDECFTAALKDDSDAWDLMADGIYRPARDRAGAPGRGAQARLMEKYRSGPEEEPVASAG